MRTTASLSPNRIINVAVLMTCHNRRAQTLACLTSLFAQQEELRGQLKLTVWLVDDGSHDGTSAAVEQTFPQVRVIVGTGDLFWCGGMALAWSRAADTTADAFLWLNDDVVLLPGALATLRRIAVEHPDAVVVGSCRDPDSGKRTYGGLRRLGLHPGKIYPVEPGVSTTSCDTFEGNIVWVPESTFVRIGPLARYRHAMGDIDYGYRVSEYGIPLLLAPGFLGECKSNSRRGTWEDRSLKVGERLKKLRSVKGLPAHDWWQFCRRNGGLGAPLYFVTPILRILSGR